jgi:CRISPR/Cas system-associated protein Cas10 (large subunit of type III CRISPR-Cas system)
LSELEVIRTCALLHDIGKLECWANRKPWSEHTFYTYKFVRNCLGEEIAVHAMRHHVGTSYSDEYRPRTEVEKIVCLADNLASGADRREEPNRGPFVPSPPIELTHVLSTETVRRKLEARDLAYLSQKISKDLDNLEGDFAENPKATYIKIFNILNESELSFVPADTRKPINDVSLWNHMKLTAAFATCIYLSGGWRGMEPKKYEFALLSGDADRISSFINESLRLPDLNARSKLIVEAVEKVREFLSDLLGPECILFAAGGSFLALCPLGLVKNALNEAKKSFEALSGGRLSITVSYIATSGDEFQKTFGNLWEKSQQQMRLEKSKRFLVREIFLDEGVDACDVCRIRSWTKEDEHTVLPIDASPRYERLCDSCWKLREEGKGVWLNDLKDKSNFVACIRADGDDVGRVLAGKTFKELNKSSTPSRISTLSDIIHGTCEREFKKIVKGLGGRLVFAGGDDLLAFVPGMFALEASKTIALRFWEKMAGKCTMSAGVAIFQYKLPVYVGVEAAGYLLSKAKEEGKNKVAFAVIGGSGVTPNELEIVRPRSWEELDVILETVSFMRKSGFASSQLRRIASVATDNPEKAEVLIKYSMGRGAIDWYDGKKLLSYLKSGLLGDAFVIYNLFRGD